MSGSYAGRMAPPGIPKTVSTPADSRDRTRLCDPVIRSPADTGWEPADCEAPDWGAPGRGVPVVWCDIVAPLWRVIVPRGALPRHGSVTVPLLIVLFRATKSPSGPMGL